VRAEVGETSHNTIFALRRTEVRRGFGDAITVAGSGISRTHPHHLTASQPVLRTLRWWGVANTSTLSEIRELPKKSNNIMEEL
jgi:hypothetical protein